MSGGSPHLIQCEECNHARHFHEKGPGCTRCLTVIGQIKRCKKFKKPRVRKNETW